MEEQILNNIKEYWNELKQFIKAEDVPSLPKVDEIEWKTFFVPKLIELGAIPKKDLENNVWYYGEYRNSFYGKWNEEKQKFELWRYKFGWCRDNCNHFEDDDRYALFVPIRKATAEECEKEEKKAEVV